MIIIKSSNVAFDKREFNDFQKRIGTTMPNDYLEFLKKTNGGAPELNIVELENEEIKSFSVTDFFGINNETINDLNYQFDTNKDRIPEGYIPICRVEGGNIVCLNIDNGSIYLWDHDTELLNQEAISVNPLLPVSSSFENFLELIKPYDYEAETNGYKIEDAWIDPDFLEELKKGDNE